MPPSWGAGGLLYPARRPVEVKPRLPFQEKEYQGEGVTLRGWLFPAQGRRYGTIVHLHGSADNRGSSVGIAERFTARGYDVLAYDSRGHGESSGDFCTYGFHEKNDLKRVIDTIEIRPVAVIGTSLGAAVALQAAADDDRIAVVVSIAAFSDLRKIAEERAPPFAGRRNIEEAFRIAEQRANFRVDDVSPLVAAARIRVPVLMIHGDHDQETRPEHSKRVYSALRGRKRLLLVSGAGHNDAVTAEVWTEIERWIDAAMRPTG